MFRIEARMVERSGHVLVHARMYSIRGGHEAICGIFDMDADEWVALTAICEPAGILIESAGDPKTLAEIFRREGERP